MWGPLGVWHGAKHTVGRLSPRHRSQDNFQKDGSGRIRDISPSEDLHRAQCGLRARLGCQAWVPVLCQTEVVAAPWRRQSPHTECPRVLKSRVATSCHLTAQGGGRLDSQRKECPGKRVHLAGGQEVEARRQRALRAKPRTWFGTWVAQAPPAIVGGVSGVSVQLLIPAGTQQGHRERMMGG